ncbi:putative acyltransferase [Micrococcus lylae]|uniref:Putative acyltransferase n=1 Tax=Micrococcus lylae TaxID=1273 RepID=A0A1R4JTE6_9MICC|nr:hypothetical protein [Micrococcus lylae]SJN35541.1 putative acyltransferase [Micrococcus lylae]
MSALIMAAVLYRVLADGVSPHAALALGLLACGAARLAPEIVAKTPVAAGQALIALVFVYAGHQLASSPALRRGPVWGVPVAAVGIGLFAVGLVEPLDLKSAPLGTPVLSVLTALAVCWGLTTGARAVRSCGIRADRAIVSLAATGTGVIYVHAVLNWGLHAVGHGEGPLLPTFCLVLAGSWSAALLLARTPLRGWALGRAPAPPPLSR